MIYRYLGLVLLCNIFLNCTSFGQATRAADTTKPVVLKLKLGPFDGKNKALTGDIIKAVKLDISVTDSATGEKWSLIKFRLSWKQKDITQDPNTGAKKPIYTFNSVTVLQGSKIPDAWQKEISETLNAGEQLIFEEVLAQHPKTKKAREVRSVIITAL
jgi:hypothetical protein